VPGFGGLVRLALAVWILIAGIIAIRQALDFSTGKAVLTAVIGWLTLAIPLLLLMRVAGTP
jgi:predicted double-glycine peptidase